MADLGVYPASEDEIRRNQTFDSKNRPICLVRVNGQRLKLYVGPDAHGFIFEDESGEYIKVGNEKRWWRGVLDPLPDDSRLSRLNKFGFCSIKPDAYERNLDGFIRTELEAIGKIVGEKKVLIKKSNLFRLYPYFFEPEWESVLVEYFCSSPTLFMVLAGESVTDRLLELRSKIRLNYRIPKEHPIRNLVHCSDSQAEAIREAVIFFELEELIKLVGYSAENM